MNNQPLLSIIVPVYNAEIFLKKCLNSIAMQNYQNMEVILINDGSTDCSLEICKAFSSENTFFKVINQENRGVSTARKTGLSLAVGEYIAFVDADDYIAPNMYQEMMNAALLHDADIVECSYSIISEKGEVLEQQLLKNEVAVGNEECVRRYLNNNNTTVYLWNKVYRTSLFSTLVLDEYTYSEDYLWNLYLYSRCSSRVTLETSFYCYTQNSGGACNKKVDYKRLDGVFAGETAEKFLLEHYPNLANYAQKYILQYILTVYKLLCVNGNLTMDWYMQSKLINLFSMHYNIEEIRGISTLANRIAFILFHISPKLYYYSDIIYQRIRAVCGNE